MKVYNASLIDLSCVDSCVSYPDLQMDSPNRYRCYKKDQRLDEMIQGVCVWVSVFLTVCLHSYGQHEICIWQDL